MPEKPISALRQRMIDDGAPPQDRLDPQIALHDLGVVGVVKL